jgi:hypothetical protein
VGSDCTLNPGEGFTMKGTSSIDATTIDGVQNNADGKHQRYDFRGKPNDGTINIPVINDELTLMGNPYPSAIDLQEFLDKEWNCTGTAYFWEHDKTVNSHYVSNYKGGYGTYSFWDIYVPAIFYSYDGFGNEIASLGSSGNAYQRKYAPIGQGFLIVGAVNGHVQMKNSYRAFVKQGVGNKSEFEKKANNKKTLADPVPQIRFNTLLNNGPTSSIVLVFSPTSSDGVDRGDSTSPNDGEANNYFIINNNEYVISAVPFDINKKIPIGFRNAAEANYKITVNQMVNVPQITNVYLHDKTTGLYHNIKDSFYDLTLPAGTYYTRYEITFKNGTLGVDDLESKRFLVQQDNISKNLTINNPQQLQLESCSVYDVMGKLIFSKDRLGTNSTYAFSTANLSEGIYIVKLITDDKAEMGTKIIVKN